MHCKGVCIATFNSYGCVFGVSNVKRAEFLAVRCNVVDILIDEAVERNGYAVNRSIGSSVEHITAAGQPFTEADYCISQDREQAGFTIFDADVHLTAVNRHA